MKLRATIKTAILETYKDKRPRGPEFEAMVDLVHDQLPAKVFRTAVFDTLAPSAGELITEALADTLAWRIAGNVQQIARGIPALQWRVSNTPEWVPAQIMSAVKAKGFNNKTGYTLSFKVLAGRPSSVVITKFWSTKFCRYAARTLGFITRVPSETSRRLPTYLFHTPIELVTLRMEILITAEFCRNGEPGFDKIACRGSLLEWNRNQMRLRDRILPGYTCPHGHKTTVPCYRCPIGYLNCQAGTHRQNYVFKPCPVCHEKEAAFDPDLSKEMCLRCVEAVAMTRT